MILDKFFVKLGYEYDPKKMEKFNKGVKLTLGFMKKMSIAAIGLATSFALLYAKIANKGLGQQRLGKSINATRVEIEGLARAANEITGDKGGASQLTDMFSNFGERFAAGEVSQKTQELLNRLGIGFEKMFGKKLPDRLALISDAFQKLSNEQKRFTAVRSGLNSNSFNFLDKFTKELFNKLKPIEANFKNIEKINNIFSRSTNEFVDSIQKIGDALSERILPSFKLLSEIIPEISSSIGKFLNSFVDLAEFFGNFFGEAKVNSGVSFFNPLDVVKNLFGNQTPVVGGTSSGDFNLTIENNISSNEPQFISGVITGSVTKEMKRVAQKNQLLEK